jgi:hypothetical protein
MTDNIRNKLEKTEELIKGVKPTKRIIKDGKLLREFTANGTRYYIRPIEEVWTVERMTAYQNINTIFALAKTPIEIVDAFQQYKQIIIDMMTVETKAKATDKLIKHTYNMIDSVYNNLNRYPQSLYICSLFIIRENEDVSKWSFELADEKIEDWAKANYNMSDFLALALNHSQECKKILESELGAI